MDYRVYDCEVLDFTGEIGNKEELTEKYKGTEVVLIPKEIPEEKGMTFDEWIKAIVDAESDIEHGVKEADRDLYELQDEYPMFFDIWQGALFEAFSYK